MGMRVYELAKKLGMENKTLLPELKKMGIAVASHSSALDDDVVQKVLDKFLPNAKGEGKAGAGRGEQAARAAHDTGHAKAGVAKSQVVEQPAKPDKRRILIKRRKEEESPEPPSPAPVGDIEPGVAAAPAAAAPAPPAPATPPVTAEVERIPPAEAEAPSGEVVPLTTPPPVVPAQESVPVKPTIAAPPSAAATVESVAGKKKSMAFEAIDAAGQKEKLKKVRKPGRPKDEEHDVKFREDAAC